MTIFMICVNISQYINMYIDVFFIQSKDAMFTISIFLSALTTKRKDIIMLLELKQSPDLWNSTTPLEFYHAPGSKIPGSAIW